MNRSISRKDAPSAVGGTKGFINGNVKPDVTDGNASHASQHDFFAFPPNCDAASDPVKEWENGRAPHFSSPNCSQISLTSNRL